MTLGANNSELIGENTRSFARLPVARTGAGPIDWALDDFAEYWAAGRLNAAGRNPYDPSEMLQEQRRIGWQPADPDMMYNPPWALALAMPMGATTFHVARSIWLSVQLFMTLWCASALWMLYGGARVHVARACGVALLWMPTLVALRMGQLSPVILLGLVGFLWALSRGRQGIAGVFFSLTAVKPQLVALVYVAFAVWAIADRRWLVLAAATASIAGASLVALATNPLVFGQYQQLMASAPPTLAFESPNIATVLRVAIGTAGSGHSSCRRVSVLSRLACYRIGSGRTGTGRGNSRALC